MFFDELEIKRRATIVTDAIVYIDGEGFLLSTLLEDIRNIGDDVTFDASLKTTKMYLKYQILESVGSRKWYTSAEPGKNRDSFLEFLENIESEYIAKFGPFSI